MRLDRAIARIEAALQRQVKAAGPAAVERDRLALELESARRDYAVLAGRTDIVAARLDAAIGRLKTVLAE